MLALGWGSWHLLRRHLLFLVTGWLLMKSMAAAPYSGREVPVFRSPVLLTPCSRCAAVLCPGTAGHDVQAVRAQGAPLDLSTVLRRVSHRNRTNRTHVAYLYTHMIVRAGESQIGKAGSSLQAHGRAGVVLSLRPSGGRIVSHQGTWASGFSLEPCRGLEGGCAHHGRSPALINVRSSPW